VKRLQPRSLFVLFVPIALRALALLASAASAQVVYRCGSSYSQTPCANGVIIATDDARSESQRAAALQALDQDKQRAKDLEDARLKEEARAFAREQAQRAAPAHQAGALGKAEEQTSRHLKPHKKNAGLRTVKVQEAGVFTATGSAAPAGTKATTAKKAKR
jgi:hypothetical protein